MFKLEFDPANKPLAGAIGRALVEYSGATLPQTAGTVTVLTGKEGIDLSDHTHDRQESEAVKLRDSAAGHSESQAVSDEEQATSPQETAQQGAVGAPDVDKNGVPFNAQFCAKAAKPFYASGKTAGQWKKGTKVEQAAYDNWYAAELAKVPTATSSPAVVENFDTSQAFNQQPAEQAAATTAPNGIGEFIKWTSEMQTAGHLTQGDITEAYTVLGLAQKDISPIEPNAQVNITSLHSVLSAKVPA